jgi:uncharacterized membrane protein YbjE (DUF340 family)
VSRIRNLLIEGAFFALVLAAGNSLYEYWVGEALVLSHAALRLAMAFVLYVLIFGAIAAFKDRNDA